MLGLAGNTFNKQTANAVMELCDGKLSEPFLQQVREFLRIATVTEPAYTQQDILSMNHCKNSSSRITPTEKLTSARKSPPHSCIYLRLTESISSERRICRRPKHNTVKRWAPGKKTCCDCPTLITVSGMGETDPLCFYIHMLMLL